jgi:hypothetical protein
MYHKAMNRLVTALIVSVLAISCSKNDHYPASVGFTGTWKYIGYSGGLAGFPFTPVADSVKNYLQFDAARALLNYGNVQNCSEYTFVKDSAGNCSGLLTFKNTAIYPNQYDVNLVNDTLVLYPHNFDDAFVSYYAPNLKKFDWCNGVSR